MSKTMVVAQCGRDAFGEVIQQGKHLADAIYLKDQPEGNGWFVPPLCPDCEAAALERNMSPAGRQEQDDYVESPEFERLTDDMEGYVAYRRIMQQE